MEGYQEIAKRLGLIPQTGIIEDGAVNEKIMEDLGMIENELAAERKLRSVKASSSKPRKA